MSAAQRTMVAVTLLAHAALLAIVSQAPELDAAAVDAVFADWNRTDSPGCALGVYQAGEVLYAKGYGMADLEQGTPIGPDSVFRIASTSKQFTAACVLLLAQEGVLSLDDDVRRWVPELADTGHVVTLRHMLHHTSGLRDYLALMTLAGIGDSADFGDEDALALLARQRGLDFAPGERWSYSNSGYFLLSLVVERASGKSLRDVARERICAPLGMRRTHFHDDVSELVPGRATGYSPRDGGGWSIAETQLEMVGDGGLFTTVADLAAWDRAVFGAPPARPALAAALTERAMLNDGERLDYAAGLMHGAHRGLPVVGHGGSFVGFRSELLHFPGEHVTVVVLANASNAQPGRLARAVADVVLADRFPPEPEEEVLDHDEAVAAQALELTATELEAYTGRFHSTELDVTYELSVTGGRLELSGPAFEGLALAPLSRERFSAARGRELRFELVDGLARGFVLDAVRARGIVFVRASGDG